jgi:uncharacterized membrane protein
MYRFIIMVALVAIVLIAFILVINLWLLRNHNRPPDVDYFRQLPEVKKRKP